MQPANVPHLKFDLPGTVPVRTANVTWQDFSLCSLLLNWLNLSKLNLKKKGGGEERKKET